MNERRLSVRTLKIIKDLKSGMKCSKIAIKHDVSRQWIYVVKQRYLEERRNGKTEKERRI